MCLRLLPPSRSTLLFCACFLFFAAEFREIAELYGMTEPNLKHRDEGPKSDYYDPLVHGSRESNRQ